MLTHKLIQAMVKRNSDFTLGGIVQVDDAYWGDKRHDGGTGRGSPDNASLVAAVQCETGFVYGLDDFKLRRTYHYPGEDCALTRDGSIQPKTWPVAGSMHAMRLVTGTPSAVTMMLPVAFNVSGSRMRSTDEPSLI